MKVYKVSYWSEGPGRSGTEYILVAAKNKKAAIKLVVKECCVHKVDCDSVCARRVDCKDGILIKHL